MYHKSGEGDTVRGMTPRPFPPLPDIATAERLRGELSSAQCAYEQAVFSGYGVPTSDCWWILETDGGIDIVPEVELRLSTAQELYERRFSEGIVVTYCHRNRFNYGSRVSERDLYSYWHACVAPVYVEIIEGEHAGTVVGPLHGVDELELFAGMIHDLGVVPLQNDGYVAIDYRDARQGESKLPWSWIRTTLRA
jgi:hypothetical protein